MQRTLKFFGLAAGLCLALGTTACSDDDSGPCGNGVVDTADESCDGSDLAGASCGSLGYTSGTLSCTDQCTYDESACNNLCGDGTADPGEACDGDDHNGETCETLGHEPGTLTCMTNCTFNTSQCGGGSCGNGTIEGDEECDLFELDSTTCEDLNFAGGELACTVGCTFNTVDCYNAAVMDVGGPCTDNLDCDGGLCLAEVDPDYHWGQAGGYCYEPCDENDNCPLSGAEGVCVAFSTSSLCMKACDLANPQCGPGQACEDTPNGAVCFWARCTADSECSITGDCDTDPASDNTGWCVTPLENCTNGQDDDFDGYADCGDPECTGETNCPPGEICGNGIDDDGDGAIDCDDGECVNLGICTGQICVAPATAALTCGSTLTGESNDQTGSTDVLDGANCVDPEGGLGGYFVNEWGPEYTYTLTVTQIQEVTVTISNYTDDLDIYIIKDILGACDPSRGCFAYGGEGANVPEVISFTAYPGMTYYVVVDGFHGNISTYDVDVACASTGYEDCGDGIDNDGDNLIDCDDPECPGVGACANESDCGDGEDNDLDGATDCADSDCSANANCLPGTGFWELWEQDGTSGEFDMEGYSLTFTATGTGQGYTYATAAITDWLYAPTTGSASSVTVNLTNNTVGENIGLPFATGFPFDGATHHDLYVIDNGYISFTNEGGWMPGPNGWNVYQFGRIGPLWTDLDPATGTVTFDSFGTYVVITWDGLPFNAAGATLGNRFQLVLHDNGDIQMAWLDVDVVANQPLTTEGMVTIVGADVGIPPAEENFQ